MSPFSVSMFPAAFVLTFKKVVDEGPVVLTSEKWLRPAQQTPPEWDETDAATRILEHAAQHTMFNGQWKHSGWPSWRAQRDGLNRIAVKMLTISPCDACPDVKAIVRTRRGSQAESSPDTNVREEREVYSR